MTGPIDLHCHLLPDPELARRYLPVQFGTVDNQDEVLYRGASVGPIRQRLTDPAAAVAAMDQAGVTRGAVSIAPLSYRYDLPGDEGLNWNRRLNDALTAACVESPDRLIPIGIVPLQDPKLAASEARRAIDDLGMRALEIGTHVRDRNLDDPALEPFWTAVEECGAAIFIHPEHSASPRWDAYYLINLVGNPTETAIAVAHLIFGGVLDRHPGLRCWLAHGGGSTPWLVGRLRHGWAVRAEPREHHASDPLAVLGRNFWFDSLTHDPGVLTALVTRFGADRVVLGSDTPFDMADPDPAGTLAAAVPASDLRERVYRSGAELLELTTPTP